MVICLEEINENYKEEAKGKEAMTSIMSEGSVFLQTNHSLSLTLFHTHFHGVVLKVYQGTEIIRKFVTFHPRGSHLNLSLGISQSTSFPTNNYSAKMLDWNNPSQIDANRSLIITTLREVVKRVVLAFRFSLSPLNPCRRTNPDGVVEAVPVSFRPPSSNLDMVSPKKKRVTTLLVGETLVTFQLPHSCPFNPEDLEELVEIEKNEAMAKNKNVEIIYNLPRYTFLQRLYGWRLERRQRINGRFDMYYHHLRSRKSFRSVAEVVNYFMYEVCPEKPHKLHSTESNLHRHLFFGFKKEKKEKGVRPLKRKRESKKKLQREKWDPIFFDINDNYDIKKEENDHHPHIPMFDLNDEHQKEEEEEEEENSMYDVVGDNYNQENDEAYDTKETVEKFLAESYNNLMNLPNNNDDNDGAKKSKIFSFDINEKISEEEEEEEDDDNNQSVEEFLAEAYDNLMNFHKTQPISPKGKEKISSSSSTEKPRRKKVKTSTPTSSSPSFPNTSININSIPFENITNSMESMEVEETASITNVKQNHFNFLDVNNGANNFIFTDICESSVGAPETKTTGGGDGRGSSSASFHMDECDLINHIPESSDMFDLAMFLAKNRGGNNGGF